MAIRDRQVYVRRSVYHTLRTLAKARNITADELADEVISTWLCSGLDTSGIWRMYRRHEEEEKAALEAIKKEDNQ